MNRLIRYLTFSAPRPTFYYETGVYMTFRVLLACAVFFVSAWSAPAPARIWMFVSALVAVTAASASQTARSGAARRSEERARLIQPEPVLPCEDALRRAANVGSFCAALAPAIALGTALSGAALGTTRGLALVAAVLAAFQGAFDAAWSLWVYPAWRRRYTTTRDLFRRAIAIFEERAADGDMVSLGSFQNGMVCEVVVDRQTIEAVRRMNLASELEPEDAPMTMFSRDSSREDSSP